MKIARRFRVTSWTHSVVPNPDFVEPEPGQESFAPPEIPAAPSFFNVELLSLSMDGVEISHGVVNIQLDTAEGLTQENYSQIRQWLIERNLLSDGGALSTEYVDPLELAKSERWEKIVAIRDGLETKGFPYMEHWFDSDERSVARINTTAQAAMAAALMGQDFITEWTTADNRSVPMTRDDIIGMPVAFATYAASLHDKARILRQRINAANTIPEVHACIWDGIEDTEEV